MGSNNLYDSSVETYGTVDKSGSTRNIQRPKVSMASKVAPLLILAVMIGSCFVAAQLYRDEKQIDMDLYAIEEDNLDNKNIVWTGKQWVDEASGKPVEMMQTDSQRTQELLMTSLVASSSSPNYNCCYVSKPGGSMSRNQLVEVSNPAHQMVESGFYCHMAVKKLPSTEWPMVRLGSLREAEITSERGQADVYLANKQLHKCGNNLKFKQSQVSMLAD